MPAKNPDELKAFCAAIKLRLSQGNVVTIKCSWKLKSAPATDATQTDLLGLVQFRKGEEGPDASLTVRWKTSTKEFEEHNKQAFPVENVDYFALEVNTVVPIMPGEHEEDTDSNQGSDETVHTEFYKWQLTTWKTEIDAAIEGDHGPLRVLELTLQAPGEHGFNVSEDSGPRTRMFTLIKKFLKVAVLFGQGWDDEDGPVLDLGNAILLQMRDLINAERKVDVEPIHAQIQVNQHPEDKYAKFEAKQLEKGRKQKERPPRQGQVTDGEKSAKCNKCGVKGHYARNCYASAEKCKAYDTLRKSEKKDFRAGGTGRAKKDKSAKKGSQSRVQSDSD